MLALSAWHLGGATNNSVYLPAGEQECFLGSQRSWLGGFGYLDWPPGVLAVCDSRDGGTGRLLVLLPVASGLDSGPGKRPGWSDTWGSGPRPGRLSVWDTSVAPLVTGSLPSTPVMANL